MLQPVNQPNEGRKGSGPTGVKLEPKAKFPGVVLNKREEKPLRLLCKVN